MADDFDKIKEALDKIKPAEFEWKSDSKDMGNTAQEVGDAENTITINSSAYQYPTYSIGTTSGFNGTSGSYLTSAGANGGTIWTTNNTNPWSIGNTSPGPNPGLKVSGDAEFEGKVMINGWNISEFMETISKRLSILQPDPAKLEHFEALKKAYEHYKTLEALCQLPKKEDNE